MKLVSRLFGISLLFCSVQVNATLIDFEGLAPGTVVTNQFSEVTFSGSSNTVIGTVTWPLGQFICGDIYCIEDTILDFSTPVDNLTFWVIQLESTGKVAEFNVFENNILSATIDLFGPGTSHAPYANKFIDLSSFSNVTRLEIVNIIDDQAIENGVGLDQFSFDVVGASVPESATLALLAIGFAGIGYKRRKQIKAA